MKMWFIVTKAEFDAIKRGDVSHGGKVLEKKIVSVRFAKEADRYTIRIGKPSAGKDHQAETGLAPSKQEECQMQKYRADKAEKQNDGAIVWRTEWMGGPTLAKIDNCRLANMAGDMRRTVYITGEADTYFSIPAVCRLAGRRITGYVTGEDDTGNLIFRHCYY